MNGKSLDPYVPPLGALPRPRSVAPAPSRNRYLLVAGGSFLGPSEVGSGPEPTPHRDGPSAAEAGGGSGADSLSFSVPASSVPASSPGLLRPGPRSRRSPLQRLGRRAEKGGPRRTCSGWSFRNGKELTGACRLRGPRGSLVPPTLRLRRLATAYAASPLALPGQPAQRQRDASRPHEARPRRPKFVSGRPGTYGLAR